MFETIKVKKESNIAVAVITRPETLNALNRQVIKDLSSLLDHVEQDHEIRALIVTGEGRAFVAGADIREQSDLDLEGGRKWGQIGAAVFRRLECLEIPTLAAINGFALGGGLELVMACDLRIAAINAKLGQPEVSLGITPGFSGTQRLPRLVGVSKAKELIFTGKMIGSVEAEKIGLVNKVVEADYLMAETIEMAKSIIKNAPLAVKYSKVAIDRGLEIDKCSGIAVENELFAMCFATEDQKEGMRAYLEKRVPQFKGK